jgi:arylsulfatase A-like enzyme
MNLTRKQFLSVLGAAGLTAAARRANAQHGDRPNILWLSCEDTGRQLGCYGDPHAITPNLDALAARGIRYDNFFTTAPVCAPNRSCIITGVYATTLGTHHMRSGGEGVDRSIQPGLPHNIKCFSEYLRYAGYYCTNNAKEDYNFSTPDSAWNESSGGAHWRNRGEANQPFFAVFNYTGSHEGATRGVGNRYEQAIAKLRPEHRQDPATITPPPYHPDTPAVRENWAGYYELVTVMDYWVADRLQELEDAGLAEDTIVFFWSDHGQGMPRCKRWPYDSGTHVPLIVYVPEKWRDRAGLGGGMVEDRIVSSVDLAPTVLSLAGEHVPEHMQGLPFLGVNRSRERYYAYSARDRMDERYDTIRTVRDKRYRYIRNYMPHKPYDQYMNTAEKSPIKQAMHKQPDTGRWWQLDRKPVEELYDLETDPHEMNNLAGDSGHQDALFRLRRAHEEWREESGDLGLIPEPELNALGATYKTRANIVDGLATDAPSFMRELRGAADFANGAQAADEPALLKARDSIHPSVRYWAVVGLAQLDSATAAEAVRGSMGDASSVVRVTAAGAVLRKEAGHGAALETLRTELQRPHEWVRLHAAIELDEAGEAARPALHELQAALEDRENKYVVRIANHALNELLGTDNDVR